MRNRSQRLIVSGVVLVSGALPLAARAAVAPPGDAASVAARVGDVASISDTEAHAASEGSSSRASVLRVAGQDIAGLGGAAKSDGNGSGNLLDTGPSDTLEAQVAPWEVTAKGTAEERTSSSQASLARVRILKGLELAVLNAQSAASHKDGQSTGSAQTDAGQLTLAQQLDLVLLRSEVQEDGQASSFLVGLNGVEIGSDEQLGSICAVSAAPLIQVACLLAKGGVAPAEGAGTSSASASVADAGTAVLSPINAFSALSASGRQAAAAAAQAPAVKPAPVTGSAAAAAAPAAPPAATASAGLPRTGVMAGLLGSFGTAMLGVGLLARRLGRRPATP